MPLANLKYIVQVASTRPNRAVFFSVRGYECTAQAFAYGFKHIAVFSTRRCCFRGQTTSLTVSNLRATMRLGHIVQTNAY